MKRPAEGDADDLASFKRIAVEPPRKEFDPSRFRSLLAGLTGKYSENKESVGDATPTAVSNSVPSIAAEEVVSEPRPRTIGSNDSESPAEPAPVSNRNVAALLKQRLQKGMSLTTASLPQQRPASSAASHKQDMLLGLQRQQMLNRMSSSMTAPAIGPDGKKSKAAASDDGPSLSIQQLMQQEKFADDADMDRVYAKNVMRLGDKFAGGDLSSDRAGMDEENFVDMRMYQKKARPVTDVHTQMKQEFRQLKQQQEKLRRALDSCRVCQSLQLPAPGASSSSSYAAALEIFRGEYFLLRLKAGNYRLAPFHCELVPLEHTPSLLLYPSHCAAVGASGSNKTTSANRIDETTEAIWKELRRLVSTVRRMMAQSADGQRDRGEEHRVVLMESAAHAGPQDMHVHSVIDLVPVPASLLDEVVMSFQSAFNDASSDWAQHRAKIALTKQKPLYTAIPRHFPYYWVEWAEDDGVVHPIDQAEAGIDGRSGKNGTVDDDLDTSMPGRGHSFAGDGNGKSSRGGSSSNGFFCFDVLAVALEEDEARWRRTRPPESQAQTSRAVQSFKERWTRVVEWTQAVR